MDMFGKNTFLESFSSNASSIASFLLPDICSSMVKANQVEKAEKHLCGIVWMIEGVSPSQVVNIPVLQGPLESAQQAEGSL